MRLSSFDKARNRPSDHQIFRAIGHSPLQFAGQAAQFLLCLPASRNVLQKTDHTNGLFLLVPIDFSPPFEPIDASIRAHDTKFAGIGRLFVHSSSHRRTDGLTVVLMHQREEILNVPLKASG